MFAQMVNQCSLSRLISYLELNTMLSFQSGCYAKTSLLYYTSCIKVTGPFYLLRKNILS